MIEKKVLSLIAAFCLLGTAGVAGTMIMTDSSTTNYVADVASNVSSTATWTFTKGDKEGMNPDLMISETGAKIPCLIRHDRKVFAVKGVQQISSIKAFDENDAPVNFTADLLYKVGIKNVSSCEYLESENGSLTFKDSKPTQIVITAKENKIFNKVQISYNCNTLEEKLSPYPYEHQVLVGNVHCAPNNYTLLEHSDTDLYAFKIHLNTNEPLGYRHNGVDATYRETGKAGFIAPREDDYNVYINSENKMWINVKHDAFYLDVTEGWKDEGHLFGVCFRDGSGDQTKDTIVKMEETTTKGLYKVAVPKDLSFHTILFIKFNPGSACTSWDGQNDNCGTLSVSNDVLFNNTYKVSKDHTQWLNDGTWSYTQA